jgi:hypothetical protein
MDFVRYAICLAQGVLYWLAQSTQRTQRRFVDCRAPMNVNHFLLHLSYHHALHGGDAVRCSKLRLHCVSTLYFITMRCMVETQYDAASCISTTSLRYTSSPFVAWWRRSTMQQAASPLRLYVIPHHHALHGGDAVRCSKLHLHYVSTLYFITMRCMVETQYDAASCISTASLRYTSSPCVAWWRRSTMQLAASPLRLYFTSYFLLRKKHLHKCSKPTDYLIRFLRNNCY